MLVEAHQFPDAISFIDALQGAGLRSRGNYWKRLPALRGLVAPAERLVLLGNDRARKSQDLGSHTQHKSFSALADTAQMQRIHPKLLLGMIRDMDGGTLGDASITVEDVLGDQPLGTAIALSYKCTSWGVSEGVMTAARIMQGRTCSKCFLGFYITPSHGIRTADYARRIGWRS